MIPLRKTTDNPNPKNIHMTRTITLMAIKLSIAHFFIGITTAHAQLDLPRNSQKATVSQQIGISEVSIAYSRPAVNNREIWGKLVPYGMNNLGFGTATSSPWRAGADENTIIEFSDDVKIEGQNLAAGKYGLHMIIGENGRASIIFSRNHKAWGSYFYEPTEDALRVEVDTKTIPHTEFLTYEFPDLHSNGATVALNWEKKQIPFKIVFDVSAIVLDDIRQKLQGEAGFQRQNWEQAANFALNNGGDLQEALGWINNAIEGQFFSAKTFNNMAIKAQILQKMGQKAEVLAMVPEMAGLANTNEMNNLGYILLNMGENDKALKYFKINAKNNPTNANVFDSLGEAYKIMGDRKNAIKNLKKSLSLNPPAGVKANSERLLAELGVAL
jgi:tetratricopeptide (TPR) repeat protein